MVRNENHQAAIVVGDATDVWLCVVGLLIGARTSARHLVHLAQPDVRNLDDAIDVVKGVKNVMCERQVLDLAIRKYLAHLPGELIPLARAVKIVNVEESATQQVFAK